MANRAVKKKKSVLRRFYRVVVTLSVAIVALYCGFRVLVPPPKQALPPVNAAPMGPAPTDNPATDQDERENTTAPPARKEGYYTFLLAASDQASGNADTIMLASYDTKNQTVGVVSVPRDTLTKKYHKINSAYLDGGVDNLKSVVSDMVGIPIDYYITVNVKAFQAIVDAVDGVDFYIPVDMDYEDPTQDLYIHYKKGMRHLNGRQALEVVRCRYCYADADIGRTRTQQALLAALAKKVLSPANMTKFSTFVGIMNENVKTDLSASAMAYFVGHAPQVDLTNGVTMYTLPGDGEVTYKKTTYCYQLYPQECLDIFNEVLNPYTAPLTLDMTNMFQAK